MRSSRQQLHADFTRQELGFLGLGILALLLLLLMASSVSQAETCELQTYASSWMKTGYPFSCKTADGTIYSGVIKTAPAKRWFRRGHLQFVFDQPVFVSGNSKHGEGKFQPNRKQQIASMFLTGGASIGAKDLMDGWTNFIFPKFSVYTLPITFGAMALFEKGGDVNLRPGYRLNLQPSR